MVIILQLHGNRDLSKLFWFQPTIQQWTITLNASITQCLFGKLITTTSFAIDKSAWNQQSTVTDWNQRFDQNHKNKELTEVTESLKESWGGWGKVGSFMDWQTKKIEIKGLIKTVVDVSETKCMTARKRKATQFNRGPTQPNQPLQNPAMPPSDLFYDLNQYDSTGD